MTELRLNAERRTITGKKVKRLRRQGLVPGIVYGGGIEAAMPIQVDRRELIKTLQVAGTTNIVQLNVDGQNGSLATLVREVQRDAISHEIIHVDFQAVRMDEPIRVDVPVHVVGEAPPVKRGEAIVTQLIETIDLEALPSELPHEIVVDVSTLEEIGDLLTVGDLPIPSGAKVYTDLDVPVVVLQPLGVEEVEEEEVAAEEAEPEVVAAAEKEEEEEEE